MSIFKFSCDLWIISELQPYEYKSRTDMWSGGDGMHF